MSVKDITFHYTNEDMVKDLLNITPIENTDSVLDAGSGKNKVWYKNVNVIEKYECELEDGVDFLVDWNKQVDWVIGNPPFDIGWKFFEHSLNIATKGIAVLGSIKFFNQFTIKRIETINNKGFYLQKIHVVSDKRWFGRYYYLIFTKQKNDFMSYTKKTY